MTAEVAPRANKFTERREQTRRELIRHGIERFPVKGYSATTVEDIVRDSGMTRGAFYFHFRGKEDFFVELLRARAEVRGEWWLIGADPALATLPEVLAAMFAHFAQVEDRGAEWVLLITDFWELVKDDPAYREVLAELYEQWIDELERLLTELARRGLVRVDLPMRAIAAQAFATAEGHTVHAEVYGAPLDHLIDALVRILQP